MARIFSVGDCVRIPDGRVGRVREVTGKTYRVRVRRKTSATHQFLEFAATDLRHVDCPQGWMGPAGYVRYLKVTLAKMRQRQARSRKGG
jgi:hypothetical protein